MTESKEKIDISSEKEAFEKLFKDDLLVNRNTIRRLVNVKHGADALSLYMFFYYHGKVQGTRQVYALASFCKKGLGWGDFKYQRANRILLDMGFIEKIRKTDKQGKVTGWYTKINHLMEMLTEPHPEMKLKLVKKNCKHLKTNKKNPHPSKFTGVEKPQDGFRETNTLNKKINTLNKKKLNPSDSKTLEPKDLKSSIDSKRKKNITNKSFINQKDVFDYFHLIRKEYGYKIKSSYATAVDLNFCRLIKKNIPENTREYIETVIKNWKYLTKEITFEGSNKSKLPDYPDLKNLWLSREAIDNVLGNLENKPKENRTIYTEVNQVPKDIPEYNMIVKLIKRTGRVVV